MYFNSFLFDDQCIIIILFKNVCENFTFLLEMIHFTGDIYENFEPHLLLPFCP